jgi:hypothetical protein
MPHSKTPGQSNAASDKFNKQDAEGTLYSAIYSLSSTLPLFLLPVHQFSLPNPIAPPLSRRKHMLIPSTAKGLGASNAPAAKEHSKPGEAPVASDSGNSNVGVDPSANKPGEKGIGGPNYGTH